MKIPYTAAQIQGYYPLATLCLGLPMTIALMTKKSSHHFRGTTIILDMLEGGSMV